MTDKWTHAGRTLRVTKRERIKLDELFRVMQYDREEAERLAKKWVKDAVDTKQREGLVRHLGLSVSTVPKKKAERAKKRTPEDKLLGKIEQIARLHDRVVNAQGRAHSYGMGTKSQAKEWDRFIKLNGDFAEQVNALKHELSEYWSKS